MTSKVTPDHGLPITERVSSLETGFDNLHEDFKSLRIDVKAGFAAINEVLARKNATNWSVIFAGLMVLGSLYASAIRPIQVDIDRQESLATKLSDAVLLQNNKIQALELDVTKNNLRIDAGSPGADRRLTLLEYQINELQKK